MEASEQTLAKAAGSRPAGPVNSRWTTSCPITLRVPGSRMLGPWTSPGSPGAQASGEAGQGGSLTNSRQTGCPNRRVHLDEPPGPGAGSPERAEVIAGRDGLVRKNMATRTKEEGP